MYGIFHIRSVSVGLDSQIWYLFIYITVLDKKARFARDRAARGWSLAYHGSCIDPMDQSKPLDPTLKVAGARRIRTIRLLVND